MLDFIVLGRIPGTQLRITFSWLLLAVAMLLLYAEFRYRRSQRLPRVTTQPETSVPTQMTLALRFPRRYSWSLVVGRRQYTLTIEL